MSLTALIFSIIATIFATIWTAIIAPYIKKKLEENNINISNEQLELLKKICLMAIQFVEEYISKNKKSNPEFTMSGAEKLKMAYMFVRDHIKGTALEDKLSDTTIERTIESILNSMRNK